jgi:hypothetical protein
LEIVISPPDLLDPLDISIPPPYICAAPDKPAAPLHAEPPPHPTPLSVDGCGETAFIATNVVFPARCHNMRLRSDRSTVPVGQITFRLRQH